MGYSNASKFSPKAEDGVFLGYHVQPGFIWRQEYLVAPLKGSREAIENDDLKVIRVKRMELPLGDLTFPLVAPEDFVAGPPRLDDQNCFAKDDNHKAVSTESVVDPLDPEGIFNSGIDLYEELAKMKARASEPIPVEDADEPPGAKGSGPKEVAEKDSPAKAEADKSKTQKKSVTSHDPTRMPDGKPVPLGYNFDGIRLVRNKRGAQRPPDTSSEDWHMI